MPDQVSVRYTWSGKDRARYWATVRLRMSEQRLDQTTVAEALAMDRANLSRRLTGQVAERPSRAQVDRLVQVLGMDAANRIELLRLAGYTADAGAEPSDHAEQTSANPQHRTRTDEHAARSANVDQQPARPPRTAPAVARRLSPQVRKLALAAILASAVCIGALVARTPARLEEPMAHITSPADGSTQQLGWVDLVGPALVPRPDIEHLWIIEHLAGYYWPQQQAVVNRDHWSARARLGAGSEDVGKRLDLLLVLTPAAADKELRAWLDQGAATGDYGAMRGLPAGARVLDQVAVTITSN